MLSLFSSSTWSGVRGRVREDRHQPRLKRGKTERQIDEPAFAANLAQHQFEHLAEGIDFRAAELVGAAGRRRILEAFDDRIGDIADINRLKPGFAPADQRQHRRHRRHRGKAVEELVLRAEHDRGTQDRDGRKSVAHGLLAGRLGSGIGRGRPRIGADRRDVDKALDPGLARKPGEPGGAGVVHPLEALRAAFPQDADAIDQRNRCRQGRPAAAPRRRSRRSAARSARRRPSASGTWPPRHCGSRRRRRRRARRDA